MMEKNAGPIQKFKAGGISAKVWKNQNDKGDYFTVSLERVYKDQKGDWKTTSTMRVNDLPRASVVLKEAFKFAVMAPEAKA
ncbi:MAG: hypothetical protein QGF25_07245 [Candidatus Woesearchaeota archaeon]|jgi:hypothetical protein|nr:hypothetical protein [Candidatus Woesearchaeota archaeon]|tara:strand:- start:449 stop:691 length:243 start_codon:yes stop_codon:yes gene_type:complete